MLAKLSRKSVCYNRNNCSIQWGRGSFYKGIIIEKKDMNNKHGGLR